MCAFFGVVLVAITATNAFHLPTKSRMDARDARISQRADLFRHRMRPDSSQDQSDTTLSTAPQRTRLRELLDESEDGPSTMQVDLGFLRLVSGVYTDAVGPAGPPPSVFALATKNFRPNGRIPG